MTKCKICKTKHDNQDDVIDCHIACMLPRLKKLYKGVKNE